MFVLNVYIYKKWFFNNNYHEFKVKVPSYSLLQKRSVTQINIGSRIIATPKFVYKGRIIPKIFSADQINHFPVSKASLFLIYYIYIYIYDVFFLFNLPSST